MIVGLAFALAALTGCSNTVTVSTSAPASGAVVGARVTAIHHADGTTEALPDGYRLGDGVVTGRGPAVSVRNDDTIEQPREYSVGETTPDHERVVRKANIPLVVIGSVLLAGAVATTVAGAISNVYEDAHPRGGFSVGGGVVWALCAPIAITTGITGGLMLGFGARGSATLESATKPVARITPLGLRGGGGLMVEGTF
jgi:hypothetical protein